MGKTVRNPIAKDLRQQKYRMRVVTMKTTKPPKHKKQFINSVEGDI